MPFYYSGTSPLGHLNSRDTKFGLGKMITQSLYLLLLLKGTGKGYFFWVPSSHIWFSYIHNFSIILSRVYNEPIQRPAPSWFVDLIRWLIINKPLPMPWSRSVNFRQQHHWKRLLQRRLREQGLRCKLNRILRAEGQFSLVTERFVFRFMSMVLLF